MKKTLITILIIVALVAIVWHRVAKADVSGATKATTQEPNSLCPDISQIQKNPTKGNWTAQTKEGLWKSYDLSFATDLTKFVGAQWSGENVGQITCIYNSEQKFTMQGQPTSQATLPILLVYHALTFQPTEGKWKLFKQGIYNCQSLNTSDCPFKINLKPPIGNIYQEAESLKSDDSKPPEKPTQ